MIAPVTKLQPIDAVSDGPRLFVYSWAHDEDATQEQLFCHARRIAQRHGLGEPVVFDDDSENELAFQRPTMRRLRKSVRRGDHLLISGTALLRSLAYVAVVTVFTGRRVRLHILDGAADHAYRPSDPDGVQILDRIIRAFEKDTLNAERRVGFVRQELGL